MRGIANYRGCLTLGASIEGLYMSVMFPFRIAHPPLLIPWTEIHVERQKLLFFPGVQFTLGRESSIPLWVTASIADKLKGAAGDAWPMESLQ
jgi:hypothetical protein